MGYFLITGASKGIGESMAKICAQKGHNLVLVARSEKLLSDLAAQLQTTYGVSVEVFSCDLSTAESIDNLYAFTESKNIVVEALINNAGLGSCGAFVTLDRKRLQKEIRVNMEALTLLTHLYLPSMLKNKQGQILNIASTAAFQPGPYMSVYFATKAFVLSFSQALRHELRDTSITVTVHCPGPTESAFAADAGNDKTMLFASGNVASSTEVAQQAYQAMRRGQNVVVHGVLNRIAAQLAPIVPTWITNRIATYLNSPRV